MKNWDAGDVVMFAMTIGVFVIIPLCVLIAYIAHLLITRGC